MLISMTAQIKLVFFSIFAGGITGFLFDIYRVLRGVESPKKVLTFLEDTLFWIFASLVIFIFLLFTNYAYMGVYVYMYIALGIYLYIKCISKLFIKIQYRIMKIGGKAFRITKNNLIYPLDLLVYKIKSKNKTKL
jgi:spore cortex biosynthesis protein YabQ